MQKQIFDFLIGNKVEYTDDLFDELINQYHDIEYEKFMSLPTEEKRKFLVSRFNYADAQKRTSSVQDLGRKIKIGDCLLAEFGISFPHEISYAHLCIVLGVVGGKILVLPIISGDKHLEKAYDPVSNPEGSFHLMRVPTMDILEHDSVGILNDVKFISTTRVKKIHGNIYNTETFKQIWDKVDELMLEARTGELLINRRGETRKSRNKPKLEHKKW